MTKILVPICLYCLKCTKFGQLFLRKVIKIDATRCLDFNSKCTKMRLAAGLRPDPLGGAPPDPLAGFKGPTSKGRGGEGRVGDQVTQGSRRGPSDGFHTFKFQVKGLDIALTSCNTTAAAVGTVVF